MPRPGSWPPRSSRSLPLTITFDLPGRLPPTVESTAYFVVAAALTNAVRHAEATQLRVDGTVTGNDSAGWRLVVEVRDDGTGGADPARGTGLTGLADRVAALLREGLVALLTRVGKVTEFVDAVERVAAGGCVIDPQVVRQLLTLRHDPLTRLTPREREVLALMAEGRSNTAITKALTITEKAVSKHIGSIFTKLDLPADSDDDHRRVRAVLAYLNGDGPVPRGR